MRNTPAILPALAILSLPAVAAAAPPAAQLPASLASASLASASLASASLASMSPGAGDAPPVFQPKERAVSTWRTQAARSLVLNPDQAAALRDADSPAPPVARCVKLNNYWCIKKAGWNGEIAADGEGHVAFASALEGAAVAALLLKRYYVDFHRRTALAIVSRWAPAACGGGPGRVAAGGGRLGTRLGTLTGIAGTLRARWLAGHGRGFAPATSRATGLTRRSRVPDRVPRLAGPPSIAVGLGEARLGEAAGSRAARPITLDALLASTPGLPPSRSMIGSAGTMGQTTGQTMGQTTRQGSAGTGRSGVIAGGSDPVGDGGGCVADGGRVATYATRASAGIATGADGDLALFAADGAPTGNLAVVMANMAQVEIGPLGASPELIAAGIAEAFRPGRNPQPR